MSCVDGTFRFLLLFSLFNELYEYTFVAGYSSLKCTTSLFNYIYRSIVIGTGYNAALDSKNMTFKRMHGGVSIGTVQVAVDWLSHTVYWSDSLYRWIIAAPGQADKIEYDYYKIIADTHLEAPDGIAVDPLEG